MAAPVRMTPTDISFASNALRPDLLALPNGQFALAFGRTPGASSVASMYVLGLESGGSITYGGNYGTPSPDPGDYYAQTSLGLLADGRFVLQTVRAASGAGAIMQTVHFGNGQLALGPTPLVVLAHDPVVTGLADGPPASVFVRTAAGGTFGEVVIYEHLMSGATASFYAISEGSPAFVPSASTRFGEPNVAMIQPDGAGRTVVWAGADGRYYMRQEFTYGGWDVVRQVPVSAPGLGSVNLVQLADDSLVMVVQAGSQAVAYRMGTDGNYLGDATILDLPAGGTMHGLEVTALDDGRFIAVWTSTYPPQGLPFGQRRVEAQVFTAAGVADGALMSVMSEASTAAPIPRASVDQLADGRIAISYVNQAGALKISLWDPRTAGMNDFGSFLGDHWEGTRFADVVRMRGGQDVFFAGLGDDTALGQAGNDSLYGGTGNDGLYGGGGIDTLEGDAGNDRLDAGSGNDVIYGDAGADSLLGGTGQDALSYNTSATGVTVRLWNGTGAGGDAQGDSLSGIEHVYGSLHNDGLAGSDSAGNSLLGRDGDDYLSGLAGADTLYGGNGNDVLVGGVAADTLWGGAGTRDTVDYSASATAVNLAVNLLYGGAIYGGDGIGGDAQGDKVYDVENIIGSAFNDFLGGSSLNNTLTGNAGNDYLSGFGGVDTLYGGAGNDTLNGDAGVDYLIGGAGADVLNGGAELADVADYRGSAAGVTVRLSNGTGQNGDAAGDVLSGIEYLFGSQQGDGLIGSDTQTNLIFGEGGSDYIAGLNGDDILLGNDGNDTLDGGKGADDLSGGAGADRFVFGLANDYDRVNSFENGLDRVDLVGLTFAQFTETAIAGGVRLTVTGGPIGLILDLMGVTMAQVEATDFI
jgi:Ca2+-binding RTX toxin-like protein